MQPTAGDVYGVISLVAWSLTLMVSIKFVIFVMRADNEGEGGVMALFALLRRAAIERPAGQARAAVAGLIGVSLFFADGDDHAGDLGALGRRGHRSRRAEPLLDHPALHDRARWRVLFAIQRHGTTAVGRLFAPIIVLWFAALAAAGVAEIVRNPDALQGPVARLRGRVLPAHPLTAFLSLGAVVLVFTGSEALYADMGHFGRRAISRAWFFAAFPALMLNYIGQASLILHSPEAISNPFYLLLPEWSRVPMIVLATCATLIASQAVISGAFSVTRQVVQLGFLPRVDIRHTSAETIGQVYLPAVNWTLFVLVVGLCPRLRLVVRARHGLRHRRDGNTADRLDPLPGRRSRALAKAALDDRRRGRRVRRRSTSCSSRPTSRRSPHGGWFPLLVGAVVLLLLTTWDQGRRRVTDRRVAAEGPLREFIEEMHAESVRPRSCREPPSISTPRRHDPASAACLLRRGSMPSPRKS